MFKLSLRLCKYEINFCEYFIFYVKENFVNGKIVLVYSY